MIRKMMLGLSMSTALIAPDAYAEDGADAAAEAAADEIIVTGRVAKLYRIEETASGKMPTEPLASSQSITVLTEQLIDDQGARDAQDLYRNISGVSVFSYAGVTARGFRQQENFYDGLRGDPYIGFAVPQLFNIERVEFLKGPAGMLYGQTAPGGLFNYVTKKPSQTFAASARIVAGTEDRYGGQVEVTGPVNDVIALRGGAFFEDRDLPRYHAGNRSLLLDAGASFDLGIAKLTTQVWRIEQDLAANRLRGIAVDADGHFLANRRWNHNEPSDFLDLRSTAVQAKLEFEPTENLKLDVAGRRIDASEKQKYHEPIALLDRNADGRFDAVARQYRDQYRGTKSWSFGGNAVWSAQISDTVSNRVLAGFDYSTEDATSTASQLTGRATAAAGLPCPLDFANPVYRACDPTLYNMPAATTTFTETKRNGFYLLNELTLGRLIAVAGIRTDSFEDVSIAANGTRTRFKDRDESYRVGLVWRVRDDLSLFGQYATSFEPQSASAQDPRAGGPFPPTTGDMFEGGVKTALLGGRIQSSLSVYRIKRQNLLQADPGGDTDTPPDGINNSLAFGEVTSKGVDVDIAADITDNWVLTLTYAYNDTKVTKSTTVSNGGITNVVPGGRFANAPKNKLGFWTRYQIPSTGLAFALGGDYVSKRISLSNQPVNPYFVFDGSVSWTRGPWDVRLRVDNIFDKTYAASGFNDRGGHFPGRPRSAFVELGYKF
ncbi:TonB-dependent receptor [Sphingopyxis sp.]|jgi:iron complex outermembrane receptor protein|uniref:TonB-dependent siderophore receptor n=1 Tax=Sphingopyxis sp. TaxID=1908224 RepID=UPI002DF0C914|nr:TonB-dependent receptor [Sphingopyxis sp.]